MRTNRPACTIWEKTVVNHAPAFVRHGLGAVWWEDVRGQKQNRDPEDGVFINIPARSLFDYIPKKDDRIMPGNISGNSPPKAALTVMHVRDCLHGSATVQHVEVKAE